MPKAKPPAIPSPAFSREMAKLTGMPAIRDLSAQDRIRVSEELGRASAVTDLTPPTQAIIKRAQAQLKKKG